MREDLEKLLELQRKTKAGEVAPLVMPGRKSFWTRFLWEFLLGRAIRVWTEQLQLRQERNEGKSDCGNKFLCEFRRVLSTRHGERRTRLIEQIMTTDSFQAALCISRRWDGLEDFEVFYGLEERFGKLKDEEIDELDRKQYDWAVGDLLGFMEQRQNSRR